MPNWKDGKICAEAIVKDAVKIKNVSNSFFMMICKQNTLRNE